MRSFLIWLAVDLIWANIYWILGIAAAILVLFFIIGLFLPEVDEESSGEGASESAFGGIEASDAAELIPGSRSFGADEEAEGDDVSSWFEEDL
ncbi:hypothetical protein [uncultured Erythrobacter sp.]|uniref:hypothetical protein n=1 Tax=uncultured Erythrobacter sp. TaxID=263913 RepID=UPI0026333084|nr:hypothetical protein [uncultured Erythrobacter sp.]